MFQHGFVLGYVNTVRIDFSIKWYWFTLKMILHSVMNWKWGMEGELLRNKKNQHLKVLHELPHKLSDI